MVSDMSGCSFSQVAPERHTSSTGHSSGAQERAAGLCERGTGGVGGEAEERSEHLVY